MSDLRTTFLNAALWHGSISEAEAILDAHPDLATADIHTAAVVGNADAVRAFLALDQASVRAKSAPFDGEPLVYLCLSRYLRFERTRSDRFLRTAKVLLDAGADANAGFWMKGEFETPLYGAAGVAHDAALTRLLIERGADPNDVEVAYHAPETRDNAAIEVLVETGRLAAESLAMLLLRKHDWHDYDGVKYLLEHGADPNFRRRNKGRLALHQAIARDNGLEIIELLLDHGADPSLVGGGATAFVMAARAGRSDVLSLFAKRGVTIALAGIDRLIAACAMGDAANVRAIATREPHLVPEVIAIGGDLLARFAGTDNTEGVRQLLDLGVDVAAPFQEGDGYFDEPKGSLPIHVAAWRARPDVLRLLIERGSAIDRPDPEGRTPLALAVRACTDSYWTEICTPELLELLLQAGASVRDVPFPTGRADVDDVLRRYRIK